MINMKLENETVATFKCREEKEDEMIHYIVWCSEHGRVSVWASQRVAEPQRNWHELQHLEGVVGKQTVVKVQVISE